MKLAMIALAVTSYYWQPQMTASGEKFNPKAMTAAHRTLPFGTKVQVTNPRNGKSVVVRINDRGPFIRGRDLDLSKAAAAEIGILGAGVAKVNFNVVEGLHKVQPPSLVIPCADCPRTLKTEQHVESKSPSNKLHKHKSSKLKKLSPRKVASKSIQYLFKHPLGVPHG